MLVHRLLRVDDDHSSRIAGMSEHLTTNMKLLHLPGRPLVYPCPQLTNSLHHPKSERGVEENVTCVTLTFTQVTSSDLQVHRSLQRKFNFLQSEVRAPEKRNVCPETKCLHFMMNF